MRKRDFYGLPRSLQDRFIESSQGVSVPKPLLVSAEKDWTAAYWAAVALFLAGLWVFYIRLGFGDLGSALALGGLPQFVGHAVLVGSIGYCAVRSYAHSWESSRRPYGSGLFLFPAGIVRARGSELTDFDAKNLSASVQGNVLLAHAGATKLRFVASSAEQAQHALSEFEKGQALWQSLAPSEELDRARLSPLVESGVPNPLAPTDAHPRPRMIAPVVLIVVACVLAVSLGYTVHFFRTKLSEEALYRSATEQNTVAALNAYIARGGKRAEVKNQLLPRAELQLARSKGSVASILAFRDKHRDSLIDAEIQAALREALIADLEAAQAVGTLTALDALAKRHKDSGLIAGEIAHARRAVIEKAFLELKASLNPETPELLGFFRRLLAYAEQHGPRVELRISQEFTQNPREIDGLVMKAKKYFLGQKQLPTQYFLGEPARTREKALLVAIAGRLQRAVSPDVLKFEVGTIPPEANIEFAEPEVPTLTFLHKERLSGGFVGGKPRGMYMGVAVYFTSVFEIPGQEEPLEQKLTQWRPPRFAGIGEEPTPIPQVYEDMMGGAFEKYQQKYFEFLFRQP